MWKIYEPLSYLTLKRTLITNVLEDKQWGHQYIIDKLLQSNIADHRNNAVAHETNQILVFYYQRYLQQLFSLEFNDLKSCYDIIVHSDSSLSFQCLGVPLPSIIIMLDTMHIMSHKVRTAYWYSNLTYSGDTLSDKLRHFMMIICQGNCFSSQLWSIISYIVFSALRTQGLGIHFVNYFTTDLQHLVGFSYVD